MVHLHLHTEYSLLDSIIKIPDLVKKVKNMGQTACAITDHGSLGGFVEFYNECKKQEIKPIFGCEFYHEKNGVNHHLVLLARNKVGFQNLINLNNAAIENFYKKPRINDQMLEQYWEGLIALSGCVQGYLQQTMLNGNPDWPWFQWMTEVFDGEFYVEVQDNGIREQQWLKNEVVKLGLQRVATVDAHYLNKNDAFAHRVSLGIMVNKKINGPKAFQFPGEGFYIKTEDEMQEVFDQRSIETSDLIASKVEEFDIGYEDWQLPRLELDVQEEYRHLEFELDDYLFTKGEEFQDQYAEEYQKRLQYEFSVIKDNGFLPYFKIISGLCQHIDAQGKFRGWGRGSASGSLVSFLYGITKIDPLEWGLYFERFLNPDRISPPDIDLDFMPEDRSVAIEYLQKFGNIYQIGSYGTLGTKETIKSCARIMEVKTNLDQFVPAEAPVPTIAELIERKAFKREAGQNDPQFVSTILKLEGLKRNMSVHAAGVVISDGKIPIRITRTGTNAGIISTTWDMYALEDLKYVKFDILGVKNLSVLDKVAKQTRVRIDNIPLDDEKTFELIRRCDTVGVFQWESEGFREVIRSLQPDQFSELLDLNTLYRPGCLESGLTDQYIRRKHGSEAVTPIHPKISIQGQQGLPLYQEDIMKMAQDLAGFTLAEADTLRKAIGKKIKSMFGPIQEKFVAGCKSNGITEQEAMDLWDKIEKFARYTWNKAHSVAYTLISWWTAYFSAHYPAHFFCEMLNNADSVDRRKVLFAECRRRGVKLRHPDINESDRYFKVVGGEILIGLNGIRYVGEKTLQSIFKAREEGELTKNNIIERTKVNKRMFESLNNAGVFGEIQDMEKEKEALGFNVDGRMIDKMRWSKYMVDLGEVIDIHKITTKRGDPMAFLKIEFVDRIQSVTVFPDAWSGLKDTLKVGSIGLFKADERGVLVRYCRPDEYQYFKVWIDKPEEFMSFCPSKIGEPNVFTDGFGISAVTMTEQMLQFVESEFGLQKISI